MKRIVSGVLKSVGALANPLDILFHFRRICPHRMIFEGGQKDITLGSVGFECVPYS
jgi:hypothetical protein